MTKIYTRSGDQGETSLIYGRRIAKDALRVQSYGVVDEANSVLGLALSLVPSDSNFADVYQFGMRVQRDLFDVGRDLATPEDKRDGFFIGQEDINILEQMIDTLSAELPPLTQFILPGGHPAAAAFHHARTVTRSAERMVVALERLEPVQAYIRKYLNRLSDLLFVLARVVNHRTGVEEPGVDFKSEKRNPFEPS